MLELFGNDGRSFRCAWMLEECGGAYRRHTINMYLAENYGTQLWPAGAAHRARAVQWLAWTLAELEGPHDAANRHGIELDHERLNTALIGPWYRRCIERPALARALA